MSRKIPDRVIARLCGVTERAVAYWRDAGKLGDETREDINARFGPFYEHQWQKAWSQVKRPRRLGRAS